MAVKVFLVEDNAVMREQLGDILKTEAQIDLVGIAETEAEAKDWLEKNPDHWDIALVDLFLLEGTGAGVVRHCRNRLPRQAVLVMTSQPVGSLLHHCRLLGADSVYDKNTELDDLIAHCIGLARNGRERFMWQ